MQSYPHRINRTARSMKKVPYILKNLSIRKMPGFPRGLTPLNDLAANVNIITGANASGKSSTARVIQQLIWHNNTKGLEVEGSAILSEDSWDIKIDSGRTLVQRNGIEDQITGLPTAEGQHRYLLALHNLVEDKEIDLAKEIAKQSIGGFDLEAAQEDLEYSSRISNKGISEYKKLEETERKYREVRDQQRDLKKDEGNLTNLKFEKEKAEHAARLNEFYNNVADYLEAKSEYTLLKDQIGGFENSMEKLSGEEYKHIEEYESQIEECKNSIEKAKDDIEKSQNELKKLIIPEDGITDKTISEIEDRLDQLSDIERSIHNLDKQIAGFKSQKTKALEGFDDSIDPAEWKNLSIDDVGGLDKMLQDAHQVLGEKEFLLSEIEILEEEAKDYQKDNQRSEVFTQGIKTLSEWLKEPTGGSKGISLGIVILISLAGVATAIITYFIGWPGLLGLIVIAVLFIYAYFTKDKSSDSLNVRESDFTKSGLTAPSPWNTKNVAHRIDELTENLSDIKETDRIIQRLKNCRDRLDKLKNRIDKSNSERKEWVDKLQAAPGFPKTNSNDFSSLYWFLLQVKKWQDAHIQSESLVAEKEESRERYQNELRVVNALLEKSDFDKVNDATEGKASFNELKAQENTRINQVRIIEQKNEEIKIQKNLKLRNEEKLSKIYQSIDVAENEKETVQGLINKLDNYKQVSRDHYAANQVFSRKQKLLQEHSLYIKHEEEIKNLSIDQAEQKSSQNKDISDGLEDIQKQITEIETLIQTKKKGHELEDVLTEKEKALDSLHQLYKKNLSSITGNLIINQLKKETQNKNRPKVFNRAKEIFSKITNGRYELSLDDRGEPNFRAYDTVLKLGQGLSELSTGTRVQLLLSVRLAYVETVESSIKLPLLADELLANSDDERARAIIESLIEISREGRQVFYFTAQADEVDKWMTYLKEQPDLDHKIFQLDGGSNKSYDYSEFELDPNSFRLTQKIPAPNGKSHKEYGEIIQKQPFNILIQNTSELQLWYLIEDVDLLHDCLDRGIKNWGQLESYFDNDGKIQNFDDDIFNRLRNRVELLKRFQGWYRKGRSLPIDRDVLVSSDAITPAFIDRVADKLNELNRDPNQLIQALRYGEIPRFRADNADDLEQFLIAEGYIDYEEIMESDDILINMHAFISNSEMQIEEAGDFINRILESDDGNKHSIRANV